LEKERRIAVGAMRERSSEVNDMAEEEGVF
jgi:hypothetical protein